MLAGNKSRELKLLKVFSWAHIIDLRMVIADKVWVKNWPPKESSRRFLVPGG